jgi:hypothetical protein
MALGVFVVVSVITGVVLTAVLGRFEPIVWLLAIAVGALVAMGTGRMGGGGLGGLRRRPRRRGRGEDTGNYRCPLCAGSGWEPGPRGRDDRRVTCRQCGGRGYVDQLGEY